MYIIYKASALCMSITIKYSCMRKLRTDHLNNEKKKKKTYTKKSTSI